MKKNLLLPFFLAFILMTINRCEYPLIILISTAVHELAHIIVAKICGAEIRFDRFLPVGLVLKYDCHLIHPLKEAAIASAGIIANSTIAVFILAFSELSNTVYFFAFSTNAVLAAINILPFSSLDGYVITDSILSLIIGPNKARKIANAVSDWGTVAFVVFCLWFNLKIGVNPSLAVITLFLCFSLLSPAREYETKKPHAFA